MQRSTNHSSECQSRMSIQNCRRTNKPDSSEPYTGKPDTSETGGPRTTSTGFPSKGVPSKGDGIEPVVELGQSCGTDGNYPPDRSFTTGIILIRAFVSSDARDRFGEIGMNFQDAAESPASIGISRIIVSTGRVIRSIDRIRRACAYSRHVFRVPAA